MTKRKGQATIYKT